MAKGGKIVSSGHTRRDEKIRERLENRAGRRSEEAGGIGYDVAKELAMIAKRMGVQGWVLSGSVEDMLTQEERREAENAKTIKRMRKMFSMPIHTVFEELSPETYK